MRLKALALFILLSQLSCSNSKITSSWKAGNINPGKYDKVLVLGLIRETDRTIREKMEEHLIGDLQRLGYTAVSSMAVFGPAAFTRMTEENAINQVTEAGADAVLTIVLLDKSKEQRFISGRLPFDGPAYYNRFGGYYTTMYDRIYSTGYYVTDTKYFWESNFYDMSTRQLLYSVQTQSFSPSSSQELGHHYGLLIVNDMIKKHVLMPHSLK